MTPAKNSVTAWMRPASGMAGDQHTATRVGSICGLTSSAATPRPSKLCAVAGREYTREYPTPHATSQRNSSELPDRCTTRGLTPTPRSTFRVFSP